MRKPSKDLVFKATCAILIVLLVGQISLLFISQCEEPLPTIERKRSGDCVEYVKGYLEKMAHLEKQFKKLKEQVTIQSHIIQQIGKRNRDLSFLVEAYKRSEKSKITHQIRTDSRRDLSKEFSEGEVLNSEFVANHFNSYSFNSLYLSPKIPSNNPAQRPLPQSSNGKEYNDAVNFAVKQINEDSQNNRDTSDFDLVDGITRTDSLKGAEYELYFRTDAMNVYHKIKAVRIFSPIQLVGNIETIDTNHDIINLILPLSGRIDKFKLFMEHFIAVGIHWDHRIHLTVVYFGQHGKKEIQQTLANISKAENFTNYEVIYSNRTFSRGLGLQKGALAWNKGNVLLFFCDVDVYFSPDFLERCRFYSSPGRQVYYPIVFSLYNPMIVYSDSPPPLKDQFKINRETGFWREYGFGMVCQYRSDFIKTGGFDLSIKGWGKEDIKLYRRYLYSKIKVVRSADRGIFHVYHHKHCKRDLTDSQYIACLNSKIKSEGSQTQLGLIAFGGNIFDSTNPNWIEKLQVQAKNQATTANGAYSKTNPTTEVPNKNNNSTL